jgi:hypothetical protein
MDGAADAWFDRELADCTFADERLGKRLRLLLERMEGAMPNFRSAFEDMLLHQRLIGRECTWGKSPGTQVQHELVRLAKVQDFCGSLEVPAGVRLGFARTFAPHTRELV